MFLLLTSLSSTMQAALSDTVKLTLAKSNQNESVLANGMIAPLIESRATYE